MQPLRRRILAAAIALSASSTLAQGPAPGPHYRTSNTAYRHGDTVGLVSGVNPVQYRRSDRRYCPPGAPCPPSHLPAPGPVQFPHQLDAPGAREADSRFPADDARGERRDDTGTAPDAFDFDQDDVDRFNDAAQQPGGRTNPQQSTPRAAELVNVNTIGDFFGEALQAVTIAETRSFAFHTEGFIVTGTPGSASALLVFEANGGVADDFTTFGTGQDASGDGFADTFSMTEPLPPNEVPTSPGGDFSFDGGTVVYTGTTATTQPIDGAFPASSPNNFWYASYSYSRASRTIANGLALRRIKISEMNSPLPKHRIYGSFNFYNDVINGVGDVSRYFLGIEKAYCDNLMSIDVRIPFSSTLDSTQTTSGIGSRNAEFGNLTVTTKAVLMRNGACTLTGGLGLSLPTAKDAKVVSASSNAELLRIDNDAVHVLPYVAGLWTPNSLFFMQWFLQWDIDTRGNDVHARHSSGAMLDIGRLDDQTLTFADLTMGTWLRRCPGRTLWGIVPVAELHYATTGDDADSVSNGSFRVGSAANRYDVLNLTLGSHFMFRESTLTTGLATPLRRSNFGDRQFDYEAVVQLERRF